MCPRTSNMMRIRRTKNEGRVSLYSLSFIGNNGTKKFPLSAYSRSKDGNNKTRKKHESKRYMEIANVFLSVACDCGNFHIQSYSFTGSGSDWSFVRIELVPIPVIWIFYDLFSYPKVVS